MKSAGQVGRALTAGGSRPRTDASKPDTIESAEFLLWRKAALMKARRVVILLSLGLLCNGCGTFAGHLASRNGIYQGVRTDFDMVAHEAQVAFALDIPFSAACDTLLLPFDAAMTTRPDPLRKGWRRAERSDLSREILDDYAGFIRTSKLPQPTALSFYYDGSGRHAVTITTQTRRRFVNYTLMYNTANIRTKVVKWREWKVSWHM
jgi:uncharacterized protein YceK